METMLVQTKRCSIRYFEEQDIAQFAQYHNDQEWMRYQSWKERTEEEYKAVLLGPQILVNGARLAVVSLESGALLGDLFVAKKGESVNIGYSVNRAYARQGYIQEALEALLPILCAQHPTCELIALVEYGNIASEALLQKLGFRWDCRIQHWKSNIYVWPNSKAQKTQI